MYVDLHVKFIHFLVKPQHLLFNSDMEGIRNETGSIPYNFQMHRIAQWPPPYCTFPVSAVIDGYRNPERMSTTPSPSPRRSPNNSSTSAMIRSNSLSVGDLTNAAPHSRGGFPQSPQSADHAETEMLIIKDKSSMEQRYDLEGAHPAGKPVEPEGPRTEADSKVRTEWLVRHNMPTIAFGLALFLILRAGCCISIYYNRSVERV